MISIFVHHYLGLLPEEAHLFLGENIFSLTRSQSDRSTCFTDSGSETIRTHVANLKLSEQYKQPPFVFHKNIEL